MKSTDSEQEGVGMELEQYRNRLEQMVLDFSSTICSSRYGTVPVHADSFLFGISRFHTRFIEIN